MPLKTGKSDSVFVYNAKEMMASGRSMNDALASASVKRDAHVAAYTKRDIALADKRKK